jgi:DNA-binding response OmpR family regulator
MPKILVVEDDSDVATMIGDALVVENYTVETVGDGLSALDLLKHYEFDLVILDWELPHMTGVEILREVRGRGNIVPVLMLTGKTKTLDKQDGLDAGADDYLIKPFEIGELRARLRALLRRASRLPSAVLKTRDLELDFTKMLVTKGGASLKLLPKEFALLEFFMRHPGQVFNTDALLNKVWPSDSDSSAEALRMCLARLRKKIETEGGAPIIETVHGMGYRLNP